MARYIIDTIIGSRWTIDDIEPVEDGESIVFRKGDRILSFVKRNIVLIKREPGQKVGDIF